MGFRYNWSFNRHRICDINDCEWSSHYTHTSCLVYSDNKDDYEEETINIHGESITAEMGFGASTYQVHAYDIDDLPDYVEEIEYNEGDLVVDSTVDNNKYGAVCLGNHSQTDDFTRGCQITICDISGCTETETDECRLPGKQGIVEPDRCYIDNPVCNLDGSCDSDNYDLKPMNPPCPEQDLICTEDGWECS